ncbi:hypothetical protein ACA910_021802 [Epithemia clementina (nom. ined.)]
MSSPSTDAPTVVAGCMIYTSQFVPYFSFPYSGFGIFLSRPALNVCSNPCIAVPNGGPRMLLMKNNQQEQQQQQNKPPSTNAGAPCSIKSHICHRITPQHMHFLHAQQQGIRQQQREPS